MSRSGSTIAMGMFLGHAARRRGAVHVSAGDPGDARGRRQGGAGAAGDAAAGRQRLADRRRASSSRPSSATSRSSTSCGFLAGTGSTSSPPIGWCSRRHRVLAAAAREAMIQWLRRRFIAGFFVTVPLVDQRRGVRLDLPADRRLRRPVVRGLARARGAGARHPDHRAARAAGRRARDQRHRQAGAAAGRELPAARAGVPHDLRAGEAAGRRVLSRQRVRLQARRAGRGARRAASCSGS